MRLVAATNVRLQDAVAAGHFREDLFYRLNVVHLALPTLRERPGDILPLARHFIRDYRDRLGYGANRLDHDAEAKLQSHPWPGNIRELENTIHHALLVCQSDAITANDLQFSSLSLRTKPQAHDSHNHHNGTGHAGNNESPDEPTSLQALENVLRDLFDESNDQLFDKIEDTVMRTAFEFCHRNQVQAAKLLGISRNILRSRLIKSGAISALR
ncbi:DNA-binding transcriptional regulator NtrC [bioreactor metagenome]|uniref:DNA-binding transcriptional regulator NtrC n=1 Tax=bioreactor metagenome TaxID=1076179 RepID=A0A645AV45_9ZZZZ